CSAVFGCWNYGKDCEFLNSLVRWLEIEDAVLLHQHWHAVEQVIVRTAARSIDIEGAFRILPGLAIAVCRRGKIPPSGNAGDDQSQVLKLPAIIRQFLDRLPVDNSCHGAGFGL